MKNKLATVIIDDEPDAVSFIASIIEEYCHPLEVVGKAHNINDGIGMLLKMF